MVDFLQFAPLSFPSFKGPSSATSMLCDCEDPFSSVLFTGEADDALVPCGGCFQLAKPLVDEAAGDVICTGCGLIRDRVISEDAEYRLFADSDQGSDPRRVEKVDERFTMSTSISSTPATSKTSSSSLIKTQAQISKSYQERKVLDGFTTIDTYCALLNAPTFVLDEAKNILFELEQKRHKNMRGCRTESMYAAAVIAAAKRVLFGITFKEVSRTLKINEKDIRKNYQQLQKVVNLKEGGEGQDGNIQSSRTSPSLLTNQYCAKLQVPYKVTVAVNHVAFMALPLLEGKKPSTIAGASMLVILKQTTQQMPSTITESAIAMVAGITETTLKSAYRELLPHIAALLPKDL